MRALLYVVLAGLLIVLMIKINGLSRAELAMDYKNRVRVNETRFTTIRPLSSATAAVPPSPAMKVQLVPVRLKPGSSTAARHEPAKTAGPD